MQILQMRAFFNCRFSCSKSTDPLALVGFGGSRGSQDNNQFVTFDEQPGLLLFLMGSSCNTKDQFMYPRVKQKKSGLPAKLLRPRSWDWKKADHFAKFVPSMLI